MTAGAASEELFETDFLTPLDTTLARSITSKYPFIQVDGTLNFRDLGGLPIAGASTLQTRPGLIFRSGQISALTASGKEALRDLGVRTVFDFRSSREFKKYDAPIPIVLGVEILHVPIFDDEAFTPDEMARHQSLYGQGKEGFLSAYREIMDHGGPAFSKVIRHIIACPETPILFHCAGVLIPGRTPQVLTFRKFSGQRSYWPTSSFNPNGTVLLLTRDHPSMTLP